MLLARQAERRLCDFRLDQMLLQCGLMKEAKEMEQASQPAKEAEEAKEAPRPKRLRLGRRGCSLGGPLRTVRVAKASSRVRAFSVCLSAAAVKR